MHIALLAPAWPPASYPNGIVTYVHCMRQELLAQGHRVSVFSGTVEPGQTERDVHGVTVSAPQRIARALVGRLLNRQTTVFDAGRTIASAINRVHARDPIDVVEMEESFGWAADVARATPVPVVCRLHGPAFLTLVGEELNTPFGEEKVRKEGVALSQLPVITSPSRCTLADTLARYQLSPTIAEQVVNPLAPSVDLPLWDLAKCDRNMLLFVGRFDKIKGADVLIRAFQCLLVDKPDLKLVFVGPDNGLVQAHGSLIHLQEFVASLADRKLVRGLSYRGQLDPLDIAALRTGALVTVVASRRENQPYSALETMLQACPIVCTDTSGLSEIVAHGVTGLKARPEDAQDLAAQIQRIVDAPKLGRALGLAGREYVLAHHAPSKVVAQTLDVYRRAIALHRANATVGT